MALRYIDSLLEEFLGVGIDGHSHQTFYLPSDSIINWIHATGNSSLVEDAWFVPDICLSPVGIWRGLQRKGQENIRIYGGIPTGNFARDYNMIAGEDITIPSGKVLLVFVSPEFQIAKFRFDEADTATPSLPLNYSTRFTEQLWLQNSQTS